MVGACIESKLCVIVNYVAQADVCCFEACSSVTISHNSFFLLVNFELSKYVLYFDLRVCSL